MTGVFRTGLIGLVMVMVLSDWPIYGDGALQKKLFGADQHRVMCISKTSLRIIFNCKCYGLNRAQHFKESFKLA